MGGVRTGTTGWSVPKQSAAEFSADGTHLERYARRFNAVEISSSFYREHRPDTYARWASSVPGDFRFAVKLPREITHVRRLLDAQAPLARFLGGIRPLGGRLGPVLVQLPPSLAYDAAAACGFFETMRGMFGDDVACEPRHASWFTDQADAMLAAFKVARVAADPAPAARAASPGGWPGMSYRRLHGSPKMYHSGYHDDYLDGIANHIAAEQGAEGWCFLDNTASGEATRDALYLQARLSDLGQRAG